MSLSPSDIEQLAQFFAEGKRLEYSKNDFIVHPGEELDSVFFIESGLVKSFNYTRFGEENLLSLRKDGEIIGLTLALTKQKLDVMYTSLTHSVLWRLPADKFSDQLYNNRDIGPAIINMLAELYRLHSEHILNLEYRSVRERLIAFLLSIRFRFGVKKNGFEVIEVPLRHQDIASYINASRETTSRELSRLQAKGLIEFTQGLITLKNVAELENYLKVS